MLTEQRSRSRSIDPLNVHRGARRQIIYILRDDVELEAYCSRARDSQDDAVVRYLLLLEIVGSVGFYEGVIDRAGL